MKLNRLFLACVVVVLMAFGCEKPAPPPAPLAIKSPEWPRLAPESEVMTRPGYVVAPIESARKDGFDPDSVASVMPLLGAETRVRVVSDDEGTVNEKDRGVLVNVREGPLLYEIGFVKRSDLVPLVR